MLVLKRSATLQTEFWDDVANRKNEDVQSLADLTCKQLENIKLNPEDTLLEIGPGYGRLTIPLAKIAKLVTVIEPSRKMLEILRESACANGLQNISYINKRWEEVEIGKDVTEHDVVLASFSLLVADLKSALEKIDLAATKAAYVFLSAESWIPECVQKIVLGESITILSDHIIVYNLLHDLGIAANVRIMEYELRKRFTTIGEAAKEFAEAYALSESKIDLLKDSLRSLLIEDSEGFWYKRRKKVAMVWWTK